MQVKDPGCIRPSEMLHPGAFAALFALVLLTERALAAPTPTPPSNGTVSSFLRSSTLLPLSAHKVSWGTCTDFGVNSTDSNLQCGYLEVPMDYHDSSAGTARLAVIKYAATVPEKKGTIFFNPGDVFHQLFGILD